MFAGLIAVFFALVCYAGTRVLAGYPPARRTPKMLMRGEPAFLEAMAESMFPESGAIPVSGVDADLPGYLDDYFAGLPKRLRLQIRALFLLFEHSTIVFPAPAPSGRRRFSSLSLDQRAAVLEGWHSSGWFLRRLPFAALRAVLTTAYLGHPAVMRHLRTAPLWIDSPVCEADLLYPPIGEGPASIAIGPADLTPPSDGSPMDLDGPLHPDYQLLAGAPGESESRDSLVDSKLESGASADAEGKTSS